MSVNLSDLKKIRCRFLDRSTGMPLPGVVASLSIALGDGVQLAHLPVATLCTDSTGYMSFDLKFIDFGLAANGLFISAPRFGLTNYDLIASLVAPPPAGSSYYPEPWSEPSVRSRGASSASGTRGANGSSGVEAEQSG